jgi:hypothetical protein
VGRRRDEPERGRRDPPRQERGAAAQRDRRDGHDQLVDEAVVAELADEVAAADQPDVLPRGLGHHPLVDGADVPAYEADVGARNRGEVARREHPRRLLIRPRLRGPARGAREVGQDPLVRRRAHRDGADVPDKVRVVVGHAELEEPVEPVVGVGDEAVEAGRGVVLRLHERGG